MTGDISPEQMCGDINNNVLVSADWYTPVPVCMILHVFSLNIPSQLTPGIEQYAYDQPYLTPFPSSTVEPQQWNQYTRASIPDVNMVTYPMAQPSTLFHAPIQHVPGRPRSSPSTFGPSPENLDWTPSAGLGIQYSTAAGQPTPLTSTFPPTAAFPTYATDMSFETPSPPQLQQPQPRRPYQSIAPNPVGVSAAKRQRDEDEAAAYAAGESRPSSGNKRRRTTSAAADTLSDDDRLLIQLRETEALPWKDIAARFSEGKDVVHTTARLQMKYKRLRQRFRVWEEQDVYALRVATEYYERCKWQIISAKVCFILFYNKATTKDDHADINPNRCSNTASQSDGHPATANKNGASCLPWQQSSTAPRCRCHSTPALWRPRWPSSACHTSENLRLRFPTISPGMLVCLLICKFSFNFSLVRRKKISFFLLFFFGRCYSMIPTFAREHRTYLFGKGKARLGWLGGMGLALGKLSEGRAI